MTALLWLRRDLRLHDLPVHGYPRPVVDHGSERAEALERYEAARATRPPGVRRSDCTS
jgi:deoxyribodipyrimidine photolyase